MKEMLGYLDRLPLELRTELKWYRYGPVIVSAWRDSNNDICAFLRIRCDSMHELAINMPVRVLDLRRFLQGPEESIHGKTLVLQNTKQGVNISGLMGYAVFTRVVSDMVLDKLRRVVEDYDRGLLLLYLPTDY